MNKPPIHRRFALWVVDCWRLVMNNKYNPLKYIPDPSLQSYFTLVLFTMWSVYFGFLAIFYMGWLGYDIILSMIIHFAVLIPVLFTNSVFLDAERENAPWVYEWRQENEQWRFWLNRPSKKGKNIVRWDIEKEA